MTPVIELKGLCIRLGGRVVLDELTGSFSGRALGLLGPNGAGKSTLLSTLLGFYTPAAGTARIFGQDPRHSGKAVRSLIGYMPENDAFIASMTGVHFVRLMAEISGLPSREALERAHEIFVYLGLGEARYRKLGTYSIGMKQMAKLAQALVHGPKLIFLDEPTNGLDPAARQRMIRLIQEVRDAGETRLVLSSHLLRDVEECCDEVVILKEGRIAAHVNLEAERLANRRFLEFDTTTSGTNEHAPNATRDEFVSDLTALGCDCATFHRAGGGTRFKVVLNEEMPLRVLYELASRRDVQIQRMSFRRDSLEEIFLEVMRDSKAYAGAAERSGVAADWQAEGASNDRS